MSGDREEILAVVPEGWVAPDGVPSEKAPSWWIWPMQILRGAEVKKYRDVCRRVEQRGTPATRIEL